MSLFLDKLAEKARSEDLNIYNIVERTDAGAGQVQINWGNAAHDCYSIAKTVTSIAIGILSDRRLVDVNDKVSKYLSEFYPEGTIKSGMKLQSSKFLDTEQDHREVVTLTAKILTILTQQTFFIFCSDNP